MDAIETLKQKFGDAVWNKNLNSLPRWQRAGMKSLRLAWVVIRDLYQGQLNLHAMSLVYTTLLSLVPLLAFSFSVLKGLGVHNRLEPLLFSSLEALGPRGQELGERIMGFVDNVRADVLGSVGLAVLIYLIISLMQKVEASFNYVWRVQQPRSLAERFSDYLSVIIVGPLLIATALGITATFSSHAVVQKILEIEPFGTLYVYLTRILPYLIVIAAFSFVYGFIPNTKVKIRAALTGGIVAGALWQTTGWLFTSFVAGSSNYIAIYSSFAIILIFMIWLYLSWLILLLGAQVAFYLQNPRFVLRSQSRLLLSNELREHLALEIMFQVGKAFHERTALPGMEALSKLLHIPGDSLHTVTTRLERRGLLMVTDAEEPVYVPGSDLDQIRIQDILAAVRETDLELDYNERDVPFSSDVKKLANDLREEFNERLGDKTLRDLVTGTPD